MANQHTGLWMRVAVAVGLVAAALLLTGCNTVKGAGTDIHSAGQATEDAIKGN